MHPRRRADRRPQPPPYRGAAGLGDKFYLAEVDELNRVTRKASPVFSTEIEGVMAWSSRRDRSLRLVREITVREILA